VLHSWVRGGGGGGGGGDEGLKAEQVAKTLRQTAPLDSTETVSETEIRKRTEQSKVSSSGSTSVTIAGTAMNLLFEISVTKQTVEEEGGGGGNQVQRNRFT
jgi:hypothetical protein